jgi:hypothetical protein
MEYLAIAIAAVVHVALTAAGVALGVGAAQKLGWTGHTTTIRTTRGFQQMDIDTGPTRPSNDEPRCSRVIAP